ncbi:MAG: hypothetical protein HXY44_04380 [Syntrophaceae bacterium]|nr:hypothetical protein [Syntrophaceae bacterium]
MNKFILRWVILVVTMLATSCSSTSFGPKNGTTTAALPRSKFTASNWMKLDTKVKLQVMKEVIALAKKDNVIIRFLPEYYVKEVDSTIENAIRNNDTRGLNMSVGIMIHTIAAMDGDWDNGESKFEHAQKWLGPEFLQLLRKESPKKYEMLFSERTTGTDIWKHLGYSTNRVVYYDLASVNYASKDIIKVWVKTEYIDKTEGIEDLKKAGLYKPEHENYGHELYLYELNCSKIVFAIRTDYTYRVDGTLIDTYDFPRILKAIPPNSVVEMLFKVLCPTSGQLRGADTGSWEEKNKTKD